jgi:hypothetical protein
MKKRGSVGLVLMAIVGILVMLGGIGIHWYFESRGQPHKLEWIPQLVGASIAFAAFYAMDAKKAEGAGGFLLNAGVRILAVIRTGKRDDDPVITVSQGPAPSANPPAVTVEVPVPAPRADTDRGELDPVTETPPVPPLNFIPAKEKGDL